ncbi:hybrid sensor histidine kinase/response regulator [Desulforhopalus singaporensis]|uniref:histidine kinase n=1 Tax=Desulforhopalus singaporensis TaxID=91360 RepID=A0A1H0TGB2_9BACT|nr:response regulator [Desulforhopalus singaporensis]SDP53014.1 PAS domain S-box-containing protein [Desulforhopalus singaporensis]
MAFFIKSRHTVYLLSVFFAAYSIIALTYINRNNSDLKNEFAHHAVVISDDIWALNKEGANAYLQLVAYKDHFSSIRVSIPGDPSYLNVDSPPLSGLFGLLEKLNLIWKRQLSSAIEYKGQLIGHLFGTKYVRTFFPLVNILIFMLFGLLLVVFVISQAAGNKMLKKQVEERSLHLRRTRKRFQDLINMLPEMVLETDTDGFIIYGNDTARTNLKLTPGEFFDFLDFIDAKNRAQVQQEFQKSLEGSNSHLLECNMVVKNGKMIPVLLRISPVHRDDEVSGTLMIAIDITRHREMEKQLQQDQKMKTIGIMAGGVAHDLNNILSGIISYPEFLLLDLEKNSEMRKPLEAIRQAGLDAARVVSDLLTVARGTAVDTETTNLNDLIVHYLDSPDFKQLTQQYPHITVTTFLAEKLPSVDCSPIHIRKCLMNLIRNGFEAISSEGTIEIRTAQSPALPDSCVSATTTSCILSQSPPHDDYVRISICDTGIGIDPQEIEQIFEPFYSKKVMGRSGSGLGLTVVRNTVCEHGGSINVRSGNDKTCFDIYFPGIESMVPSRTEQKNWREFLGHGQTVLVIDDEYRQRIIAQKLLETLNYKVVTVSSGENAVEYLKNNPTELLLLDMIMSPGLNGRRTYEQILKHHPDQRAVIVSGYAEDDDVEATLKMGASSFVAKPYTLERLGSAIYNTINP